MSVSALIGDYDGKFVGFIFLNISDNYMRVRQRANTTDRRLIWFKFVSLLKLRG